MALIVYSANAPFMRNFRSLAVFCVLLGVLALLLKSPPPDSVLDLNPATAQVIAFPFVFLFVTRLCFVDLMVPRCLLALLAVCAALAVGFSYSHLVAGRRVFLVARLQDDQYETESRIFREEINRYLKRRPGAAAAPLSILGRGAFAGAAVSAKGVLTSFPGKIRAVRFYGSFRSAEEVNGFLAKNPSVPAVLWGNNRWVNISMAPPMEDAFPGPDLRQWLHALGLKVVPNIPVFGLSYQPRTETASFAAGLFKALSAPRWSELMADLVLSAEHELDLREIGRAAAPWTTFEHRAYPYWLLGNLAMEASLRGQGYDAGEMNCALAAYNKAQSFLVRGGNPELLAAIFNNRGVAYYVQGVLENKKRVKKAALYEFKAAAKTLRLKNPFRIRYRAGKIAKSNLNKLENKADKKGPSQTKEARWLQITY